MAVSLSSDGRYAISTHRNNALVLWDLNNESKARLADNANIYSAYFVPGREAFLWQDLDNVVRVQEVDGTELKAFTHFPTYGHAIDPKLERYISANKTWNVFRGHGSTLTPVLRDSESPSLIGSGKLLNIKLSDNDYFVTSGKGLSEVDSRPISEDSPVVRPKDDLRFSSNYGGVVLWSYKTFAPIAKLPGNSAKTHATISPDGQWVVSGDENGIGLFWNTDNLSERRRLADAYLGIFLDNSPHEAGDPRNWDESQLIDAPKGVNDNTIAIAFIGGSKYFLRFGNNSHQAALFKAGSPWPQKYFDLGKSPSLVTYGSQYSRNTAIATAPAAGVLIMGHRSDGGISVYHFNAGNKTLERTWVVD